MPIRCIHDYGSAEQPVKTTHIMTERKRPRNRDSEPGRERTVDLCFSYRHGAVDKIGRYLEEKIPDRAGYGTVAVFSPRHCLLVIVDGNNQVYMFRLHAHDILFTREGKPLVHAELGMGMKIPDDCEPVEPGKNLLNLLMAFVVINHAFRLSAGGLETEGMLYDKTVLQFVAKQKAKAFFLVDFS